LNRKEKADKRASDTWRVTKWYGVHHVQRRRGNDLYFTSEPEDVFLVPAVTNLEFLWAILR